MMVLCHETWDLAYGTLSHNFLHFAYIYNMQDKSIIFILFYWPCHRESKEIKYNDGIHDIYKFESKSMLP